MYSVDNKTKGDIPMKFYAVTEFDYRGPYTRTYFGTISDAKTPKEAVKKYLLYYLGDNFMIDYVKRSKRTGCNFIVTDCATHKKSYFITM